MSAWCIEILWLLLVAILHAVPWLADGYVWCTWLAIAGALQLGMRGGWTASWWATWGWSTLALAIAFHWSPGVMAYTIDSSYALGLIVAFPLIAWDGLRLGLGYWLAVRLTRDPRNVWISGAITTILLEYLMPGVFSWKLGYTQLAWPWIVQAVDIFGPSFSTLVAFAFAGVLLQAARAKQLRKLFRRSEGRAAIASPHASPQLPAHASRHHTGTFLRNAWQSTGSYALLLVFCNLAYGAIALGYWNRQVEISPKIRVGLIQVDPSFVESLDRARKFTASIASNVDLVCWPESSGGNYELALDDLANEQAVFEMSRDPVRGLQPWPKPKCDLLLGGKNYVGSAEQPDTIFTTAMLIDQRERIIGRYHKRYLMPFGEYVPGEATIPGLATLFDMAEHIEPGTAANPLSSACGAKLGTMLCYEDMVPKAARTLVARGSNLLVSLANGSAFESQYALQQHRLLAQSRAIECRRYFLRCAATGETCVISPLGNVESRLPLQTNDALTTRVAIMPGRSIYSRVPWLFPLFLGVWVAILARNRRVFSDDH